MGKKSPAQRQRLDVRKAEARAKAAENATKAEMNQTLPLENHAKEEEITSGSERDAITPPEPKQKRRKAKQGDGSGERRNGRWYGA